MKIFEASNKPMVAKGMGIEKLISRTSVRHDFYKGAKNRYKKTRQGRVE
jgi:hypothetical protein